MCAAFLAQDFTEDHSQIGGVVMRSPFIGIAAYERTLGLPVNYINTSM